MTEIETWVDAWLDAWTGNRPEHLASFYAEDCFYLDPARKDGVRGRDALLAYFRRLLAVSPEMRWTREDVLPLADGGLVVRWRARIPAGGTVVEERGVDLLWLTNGKIARNEVYFDRSAWLAALASA